MVISQGQIDYFSLGRLQEPGLSLAAHHAACSISADERCFVAFLTAEVSV